MENTFAFRLVAMRIKKRVLSRHEFYADRVHDRTAVEKFHSLLLIVGVQKTRENRFAVGSAAWVGTASPQQMINESAQAVFC